MNPPKKEEDPGKTEEPPKVDEEAQCNVENIYKITKAHYGSIYNLYGLGGPGTYCALGPTEAGKSHTIKELYFYATSPLCEDRYRINFDPIIALSSTAKINKEYDWDDNIIKLKPTNAAVNDLLKNRKLEMTEECEKLGWEKNRREEWACAHPTLWMMDDTYGLVDYSTPGNSCAALSTKARHYGIYFVIAAQYVKQLGPVFHDNARMWICYSCNADNHWELISRHHGKGKENKALKDIVTKHNRKAHHPVVYVTTWRFRREYGFDAKRILLLNPVPPVDKAINEANEMEDSSDDEDGDKNERYKNLEDDEELDDD